MKQITLLLVIVFSLARTHAQFVHVIKADSVLITNDSCTAELNLENSTKNIKGFLYNKGNGRTEFRKFVKLNDTTFIMGGDTLIIGGSGASRNFANADLTLTGNRLHDGDYKSLNFDRFGSVRFFGASSDIEDSISTTVLIDSTGFFVNGYEHALDSCTFKVRRGLMGFESKSNALHEASFKVDATGLNTHFYSALNGSQSSMSVDDDQMTLNSRGGVTLATSSIDLDSSMNVGLFKGDSIVFIGLISPLTKSTKYKQTQDKFEFRNLNGVNDFRLLGLPTSSSSMDSVLVSDNNGQVKKRAQDQIGGWTLQQITSNGNTTSNTIKPYPSALPVGASADSIVVWSATDSLLKKIGAKQTFAQTATVTVSGTTDQTTLISSGTGSLTIPAASWFVGKTFKVVLHGTYSTSSTPPTLTIKIKFGTNVIATSSVNLSSNKSDVAYEARAELTCRSTGSSGTVFVMGMTNTADGAIKKLNQGTTASTVDLSTNQTLNITATLSDASAGNAVSAYLILLEAMN